MTTNLKLSKFIGKSAAKINVSSLVIYWSLDTVHFWFFFFCHRSERRRWKRKSIKGQVFRPSSMFHSSLAWLPAPSLYEFHAFNIPKVSTGQPYCIVFVSYRIVLSYCTQLTHQSRLFLQLVTLPYPLLQPIISSKRKIYYCLFFCIVVFSDYTFFLVLFSKHELQERNRKATNILNIP